MADRLQLLDPVVESLHAGSVQTVPRAGGYGGQPLAHPVPLPLVEPSLRVGLVSGVREKQWHQIVGPLDLPDTTRFGAVG
ncbi:hypothetical protein ATCCBAA256_14170 [Mycobacterium montefiorense]|nr:hypothetical protein ATCCBAA256_14170 [Mycobacterium montefiorense]